MIHFDARGLLAALMVVATIGVGTSLSSAQTSEPKANTQPVAPQKKPEPATAPAANGTKPSPQPADTPELSRAAEAIAPAKDGIERLEEVLRRDDLSDAQLIENRGRLEPLRGELRELIATFEGRLADVDTRLKQLGDAPQGDKPQEDANLTLERTRLQERYAALDGALKQARVLLLSLIHI